MQAPGLPLGGKALIHALATWSRSKTLLAGLVSPQFASPISTTMSQRLIAADDEAALVAHINQTMQATGCSTNASRSPVEIASAQGAGAFRDPV